MTGATYEFLDETAAFAITYYYWLETPAGKRRYAWYLRT
jgi:hypothetical protein